MSSEEKRHAQIDLNSILADIVSINDNSDEHTSDEVIKEKINYIENLDYSALLQLIHAACENNRPALLNYLITDIYDYLYQQEFKNTLPNENDITLGELKAAYFEDCKADTTHEQFENASVNDVTSIFYAKKEREWNENKSTRKARFISSPLGNSDESALYKATNSNQLECAKILLQHGAVLGAQLFLSSDNNYYTALSSLYLACALGHSDILNKMIYPDQDNPTKINPRFDTEISRESKDRNADIPLLAAIGEGHTACVKLLLETKVIPQTIIEAGIEPAAKAGDHEILMVLLESVQTEIGQGILYSALMAAITHSFNSQLATIEEYHNCIALLIEKGANLFFNNSAPPVSRILQDINLNPRSEINIQHLNQAILGMMPDMDPNNEQKLSSKCILRYHQLAREISYSQSDDDFAYVYELLRIGIPYNVQTTFEDKLAVLKKKLPVFYTNSGKYTEEAGNEYYSSIKYGDDYAQLIRLMLLAGADSTSQIADYLSEMKLENSNSTTAARYCYILTLLLVFSNQDIPEEYIATVAKFKGMFRVAITCFANNTNRPDFEIPCYMQFLKEIGCCPSKETKSEEKRGEQTRKPNLHSAFFTARGFLKPTINKPNSNVGKLASLYTHLEKEKDPSNHPLPDMELQPM